MFKIYDIVHRISEHRIMSAIIPVYNRTDRKAFWKYILHDVQKDFRWDKRRNTKAFKISFVTGDNIITMYRFGTSSNKTILEILCPFLKCNKNIIVSNTTYFGNLQKFSDCLICHISAMGIFSYKIVDVGNRRC